MPELIRRLFSSSEFMPHGHCYFWRPEVVWLHVVSDSLIALSYVSIPLTLTYFVTRRREIPFHGIFYLFGVFIVACGMTHVMEVWTLWNPTYWLSGGVKAVTAVASVATAVTLVRTIPLALSIPTPQQVARMNAELRAVQTRNRDLAAIVESSLEAVCSCALDGTVLTWNVGAERTFGYTAEEMLDRSIDMLCPGESGFRELLEPVSQGVSIQREQVTCRRKDGAAIEVSMSLAPLRNDLQVVVGASLIARDVSEPARQERAVRASLQEKEVLLKEVHHRVKNNLQVISSLLKLHAQQVDNPQTRAAFQNSQDRVRAIALLHENLYRSKNLGKVDVGEYTRTVVNTLAQANPHGVVELTVQVDEDIELDIDTAVPYGLILNELVTNAFKHGFSDENSMARVTIRLNRRGDSLELTVSDNGRGFQPGFDLADAKGLGMHLVRTLSRQLEAQLELGGGPEGASICVCFPEHRKEDG